MSKITYEQPLNERIRIFLRLEHLFRFASYHMSGTTEWDHRSAIVDFLNIVDLISRSDIKMDLIKELEKHAGTLEALKNNRNVDTDKLSDILENILRVASILRDSSCQPGQAIRQDEFLSTIKQRSIMPSGSCNFDLPNYHFWLNTPHEERVRDLQKWYKDLDILFEGVKLTLTMVRNSSTPVREIATSGFFQKPIESGLSCQLIRIRLPSDSNYYPEISGGKHRFTVRFMEQSSSISRPVQTSENVEFELHCCFL